MPALFRFLSFSLILLLTACAANTTGPTTRTAARWTTQEPVSTATPINRPAPSQAPTGPARTMAIVPSPEAQALTPPPVAAKPLAPQPPAPSQGPIVLGAPLPTPKPFAAPQTVDPLTPPAARFTPAEGALPPMAPGGSPATAMPPAPAEPPLTVADLPSPGTAVATAPQPTPLAMEPTAPQAMAPVPTDGFGATPQPAGPPTGYAGISWGTSAKSISGLAVHEADPSVAVITYTWPAGPRDVMGAPIRDAFLEFFQDHFYHVWIDLDGMAAYKAALAGLTAAYGPPTSEVPEKYYHAWTLGDVNVYCAFHPAENEGDVSYFYQPLYERLSAIRKATHGKASKGRKKS